MNVRQWACKRRLQGCYHVRIVENVVYIAAVTVLGIFSSRFGGAALVPRAPGCYGSRAPVPRRSKELENCGYSTPCRMPRPVSVPRNSPPGGLECRMACIVSLQTVQRAGALSGRSKPPRESGPQRGGRVEFLGSLNAGGGGNRLLLATFFSHTAYTALPRSCCDMIPLERALRRGGPVRPFRAHQLEFGIYLNG